MHLGALKEYETIHEKYTFVAEHYQDLQNSKKEVLQVINTLNKDATKRFEKSFSAIQKSFHTIFQTLFGETSKAELRLLDRTKPLESGIEILVQPEGKSTQILSLLSGGERAMTAVALLFAIYTVKPGPFCILDELDAPLDEANIGRFLELLHQFTSDSQFLVVTHHKKTMAKADLLYGITMEEKAVSYTHLTLPTTSRV